MYYDKELLATRLYEILDDSIVGGVSIDEVLTPAQKYDLIIDIINGLPYSNLEKVLILYKEFEKDKKSIIEDDTTILLIITICINILKQYNSKDNVYSKLINIFKAVYDNKEEIKDYEIKGLLFKHYLQILSLVYSLFINEKAESIIHEGMLEVLDFELSKLHGNIEEVKETVNKYGNSVETVKLKHNNLYKVINKNTNIAVNANEKLFNIEDLLEKLKKEKQ